MVRAQAVEGQSLGPAAAPGAAERLDRLQPGRRREGVLPELCVLEPDLNAVPAPGFDDLLSDTRRSRSGQEQAQLDVGRGLSLPRWPSLETPLRLGRRQWRGLILEGEIFSPV